MKNYKIFCCALSILFVFVILEGYINYFMPIGSVNGEKIRQYEFNSELKEHTTDIKNAIAELKLQKQFAEKLGITYTEEEYEEAVSLVRCESQYVKYNLALKALLEQKTTEYFAALVNPSQDEIKEYYNLHFAENRDEPDYETVKTELIMREGAKRYEEEFEKFKQKSEVKFQK